jgi:hypothetical protein
LCNLNVPDLEPFPDEDQEIEPGPIVISEYAGPTLELKISLCEANTLLWMGDFNDAPATVQEISAAAKELPNSLPSQQTIPDQVNLLSQILPPYKTEYLPLGIDEIDYSK